jgi:hypothetical protein
MICFFKTQVPGSGSIWCFAGGATLILQGHPVLLQSPAHYPIRSQAPLSGVESWTFSIPIRLRETFSVIREQRFYTNIKKG